MKQRVALVFGGLAVLWLACAAAWLLWPRAPYQVLEVQGSRSLVASVAVRADTPKADLVKWAYEIKLKNGGKPILVNFYSGPERDEAHYIASFSGPSGVLTDYREK